MAKKRNNETSDEVSTLASGVLRDLKGTTRIGAAPLVGACSRGDRVVVVARRVLGALAASCLNQDQTKGKRKARR